MRRVLKPLAICLVLGFVLNLLIAWISGFVWPIGGGQRPHDQPGTPWAIRAPSGWSAAPTTDRWVRTGLWDLHVQEHSYLDVEGETPPAVKSHLMGHHLYGFPLRCLRATTARTFANDTLTEVQLPRIQRGIPFGRVYGSSKIALNPIPAGLAVNTACYGAFFLVARAAMLGLRTLRRRRRARRSLCTRCKYPVRDLPTCPECGTPVHSIPNSAALSGPPR